MGKIPEKNYADGTHYDPVTRIFSLISEFNSATHKMLMANPELQTSFMNKFTGDDLREISHFQDMSRQLQSKATTTRAEFLGGDRRDEALHLQAILAEACIADVGAAVVGRTDEALIVSLVGTAMATEDSAGLFNSYGLKNLASLAHKAAPALGSMDDYDFYTDDEINEAFESAVESLWLQLERTVRIDFNSAAEADTRPILEKIRKIPGVEDADFLSRVTPLSDDEAEEVDRTGNYPYRFDEASAEAATAADADKVLAAVKAMPGVKDAYITRRNP